MVISLRNQLAPTPASTADLTYSVAPERCLCRAPSVLSAALAPGWGTVRNSVPAGSFCTRGKRTPKEQEQCSPGTQGYSRGGEGFGDTAPKRNTKLSARLCSLYTCSYNGPLLCCSGKGTQQAPLFLGYLSHEPFYRLQISLILVWSSCSILESTANRGSRQY